MASLCWWEKGGEGVIARGGQAGDTRQFGQATLGAPSGQNGDQVDGFCDQRARDGDNRFLD